MSRSGPTEALKRLNEQDGERPISGSIGHFARVRVVLRQPNGWRISEWGFLAPQTEFELAGFWLTDRPVVCLCNVGVSHQGRETPERNVEWESLFSGGRHRAGRLTALHAALCRSINSLRKCLCHKHFCLACLSPRSECGVGKTLMTDYPHILFNKSPLQLRLIGARGGRAYGRNQRALRARLSPLPKAVPPLTALPETTAKAIAALDAQFPWLRCAERSRRCSCV
jgi:hypothetical protein